MPSRTVGLLTQTKRRAAARLLESDDRNLRSLATPRFRRGLLRSDVLGALQFSQHCFRIILELVSVGRLVHELLQIVCRLLKLRFIAGTEERETAAQIGVRIVRLLGENLLKLNDRFVCRS